MQSNWKRLPEDNHKDAKRISLSFRRRMKELRADLAAVYKAAGVDVPEKKTGGK